MRLLETIYDRMGSEPWTVTGLLALANIPAEEFPEEVRRELARDEESNAARQLAPWLARQPLDGPLRLETEKRKGYPTMWRVVPRLP